jgi:hypothetical protein
MRLTLCSLALLAWFTSAPPAAAAADILTEVRLAVRTYAGTALDPAERASALAGAAGILRAAGIEVEWRSCDGPPAAAEACSSPLAAGELAIRFVRLPVPAAGSGAVTLGYSLVDAPSRAGSLATIYVDRVARLAAACEVDSPGLLGRALAHEIGHLLLGTNQHGQEGLMRPYWSRDMIRRERAGDWAFSAREARIMRDAVRTRTAMQLAAHLGWAE